uniref:ISXO2-like transposase domain-containing protein n=1 Tax=Globodera rostochiensis TaxID=31243 RepID=A0A914GNV4_GLORO
MREITGKGVAVLIRETEMTGKEVETPLSPMKIRLLLSSKNEVYYTNNVFVGACRAYQGLQVDTWFDPSKLDVHTILKFIYWWSQELMSIKFCEKELGIGNNSVIDWCMFLREVCANYVFQQQQQIGGPGYTVEIDEALFTKRKSTQGRQLPEQWVFGGICRETRECFLVAVPDRTAATLLPIIAQRIAPGSTVHSDCWAAYNQNIERLWSSAKRRNKAQSGIHRQMLDSYFCEFL